jgi:hypothetical protein
MALVPRYLCYKRKWYMVRVLNYNIMKQYHNVAIGSSALSISPFRLFYQLSLFLNAVG